MKYKNFDNKKILVTGGAGFIGSNLVKNLFKNYSCKIFNLDCLTYSGNFEFIKDDSECKYHEIKVDLNNQMRTREAINFVDPDIVFHLAAETHVDRSIEDPEIFVKSNFLGTFNLLEAVRLHWHKLKNTRKSNFRFIHVSTDEVFGSCNGSQKFNEKSLYDPRSPYSASKASSDHLVNAWHHTYKIPTIISNCSNNYGPYQFPEKLIPISILRALKGLPIDLYGDGLQVRDWLFVNDHVEALILIADQGKVGQKYCIGGSEDDVTNLDIVKKLCFSLSRHKPNTKTYFDLINFVRDRPGHDRKYAVDSKFIRESLGWIPKCKLSDGIDLTVKWYIDNLEWCENVLKKSKYNFERIGLNE